MKHGFFFAPFGELSNPLKTAEVAAQAEASGYDGIYLWDHILRPETTQVGEAWIALAAIAMSTETVKLGPLVTPLPRRRPQIVAKQAIALDLLSKGRLILGVGLGVDTAGELSKFSEVLNLKTRAEMTTEAIKIVRGFLSGKEFTVHGEHLSASQVLSGPVGFSDRSIPLWSATRTTKRAPLQRAASLDGLFPIEEAVANLDQTVELIHQILDPRKDFEIAVRDSDLDVIPGDAAQLGVTWLLRSLPPETTYDQAMKVASRPPTG